MKLRHGRSLLAATLTTCALTAPALPAQAAGPGFSRIFATADSAETAFTNPAGMTRLERDTTQVSILVAQDFSQFRLDEDLTTVEGGDPRNPDPAVVPSLYHVRDLTDDIKLGLTLNVPSGFGATDGPYWSGRYHSDSFSLVFLATTATLGYRVNDWLAVGGGISATYSDSRSKTAVNNLGSPDDGILTTKASGVGFSGTLGVLVDITEQTSLGLFWRSESETDEDVDLALKRSNLPQNIIDDVNAADVEIELRVPQVAGVGLAHDFGGDWEVTADALWVEFSRFGLDSLSIEDDELTPANTAFKDFWVVSTGLQFPLSDTLLGQVGAFWVQQPVKDSERTFGFALDEAWGVGFGVEIDRGYDESMELSMNIIRTSDSPIDTGPASALGTRGRVAGDFQNRFAITLEFDYSF